MEGAGEQTVVLAVPQESVAALEWEVDMCDVWEDMKVALVLRDNQHRQSFRNLLCALRAPTPEVVFDIATDRIVNGFVFRHAQEANMFVNHNVSKSDKSEAESQEMKPTIVYSGSTVRWLQALGYIRSDRSGGHSYSWGPKVEATEAQIEANQEQIDHSDDC